MPRASWPAEPRGTAGHWFTLCRDHQGRQAGRGWGLGAGGWALGAGGWGLGERKGLRPGKGAGGQGSFLGDSEMDSDSDS